jgi:hypothetical protein
MREHEDDLARESDYQMFGLIVGFLHADPSCVQVGFALLTDAPIPRSLDVRIDPAELTIPGHVAQGAFEAFWSHFVHPSFPWSVPFVGSG